MNHNPHSNPEIERGIEGLRAEPVDTTRIPTVVNRMMATGRPARPRTVRYLAFAGAAAALGLVVLWPRPSNAASIQEVAAAVKRMNARYEQVFKPNKDGKLEMYMEQWGEPGQYKYSMRFVNGPEFRHNGNISYAYWPDTNQQRIIEAEPEEVDSVGIEAFSKFKLLRVEDEGETLRYVYNIRQDLIIDKKTKLPKERVCYKNDGSLLETHVYFFKDDLDDKIFQPDNKPGVPMFNIPEDREKLNGMLALAPQTQVVGGVKINLHAVILDDQGMVGAIVTGGAPRASKGKELLQVVGFQGGGWNTNHTNYTTYSGKEPGNDNTLKVGKVTAIIETERFPAKPAFPDHLTVRVPVWKWDPSLPLLDWDTNKKIGIDSRFVGYAEFTVDHPLRTMSIDNVLPNWVRPPAAMKATAVDR